MKKIYQNPTTTIVKIQTVQMIAASPEGYEKSLNGTGGDGGSALGRGGSNWDDDDY